MSTRLLYHAFGVRGYRYRRTEYVGGEVHFHVEATDSVCRCPQCGTKEVIRRGSSTRPFRGGPVGSRRTWIVAEIPRVQCLRCGIVRQIEIGFAPPRVQYTKSFAAYALQLTRYMTIQDGARHLGVSWDVIKDLKKGVLQRHFAKPALRAVKEIAIDEIYLGKHHRYLTIVLDLLRDERQECERLAEALRLNEPLATACYLKEDLREFWRQPHKTAARNFLTSWYLRAMNSGIRHLLDFARTLLGPSFGLLSYFKHKISTGPLEGTNNKIKTLQKLSSGLRDHEYFTLSLYALHLSKYALIG